MRLGESYRFNAETLGITPTEQPLNKLMVPKGGVVTIEVGPNSIVAIVAGHPDGYRMLDVTWNGKSLMISAQDLRERGELVVGAKA